MSNSNADVLKQAAGRDAVIVRTSIVGILGNVVLAAFKVAVGLVSSSIAIVLDAVNNLSDALSSLITIIGTKLSMRPADHDHPYGYGRVEYLSAIVIAAIVLAAGISSLKESIEAILDPSIVHYIGRRKPTSWTHRPERRLYRQMMNELGLLPNGRLPGETASKIVIGWFFDAYHALLKGYAHLLRHVVRTTSLSAR